MSHRIRNVGSITLTGKNRVSLPARAVRELGWQRGDELTVEIIGVDMLLLVRRPADWVAAFAGQMGDVFGDHDDTLAYLDEERRSWESHG